MDVGSIVALTLMADLVGVMIPVLVQINATLKSTRKLLDRVGPKLEATLDDVRQSARRLNRTSAGLEESVGKARALFDSAGQVAVTLQQLRRSLKGAVAVGNAVGPALAAAIRAFGENRSARSEAARETESSTKSSESTEKVESAAGGGVRPGTDGEPR